VALALAPVDTAPDVAAGAIGLLEAHEVARWETRADGRASELVLEWPEHAIPRRPRVTIAARASLGPLVHHWEFEAGSFERGQPLAVALQIPDEAQLDDAAADYVVDLLLTVHTDGAVVTLPPGDRTADNPTVAVHECMGDYRADPQFYQPPLGDHVPWQEDLKDPYLGDTAVPGVKGAFSKEH
jgi:hypothetical protein